MLWQILHVTVCYSLAGLSLTFSVKHSQEDASMVSLEKVDLYCPHSGIKITDPVRVPGSPDVYDKQSVLETIES